MREWVIEYVQPGIIRHNQTGYKYLGYDKKPVNKIWREILEKYDK